MKPVVLVVINHPDMTPDHEFADDLITCARETSPEIDWVVADDPRGQEAEIAACWYPPASLINDYPNLKVLHSVGAGIDHFGLLADLGVPIERIADPEQNVGMWEYVLWGVLYYQRDMDRYHSFQTAKRWQRLAQRQAKDIHVGVLGLGQIGAYVASRLAELGYQVSGWSKSHKSLVGVTAYAGLSELPEMLSELDILVNLLPLNSETHAIINRERLAQLPDSAALIHCGRGEHLVESDLKAMLENNRLRGAILDVFALEPLSEGSHWWQTRNVLVTPHVASCASLPAIVAQISEKVHSVSNYMATLNVIEPIGAPATESLLQNKRKGPKYGERLLPK